MIVATNYGAVRELRMNRPPVNALNLELVAALRQAVERAPQDGVRALVVSGAQGRFSAGLDVPLLLGLDRSASALLWREFYALLKALARSPIPIVAAITGHAPAGGTVVPLFCDWRVGADGDFKLGLSEVQVGIILPPIILAALRRQVGARQAERLTVPTEGMEVTRWNARSDLVGLFDNFEAELEAVTEDWWRPQTQHALRAMVERLAKKSG